MAAVPGYRRHSNFRPSVQVQYRMHVRCKELPAQHIADSWQLDLRRRRIRLALRAKCAGQRGEKSGDLLTQLELAPARAISAAGC